MKTMPAKVKRQNVSFRDVQYFLEFLPANERKLVEPLREIIFNCIPGVTEKLSYNVPFYKRNKNICFIWPASVLWGHKKSYEGVRFGFSNGYLLNDEISYLDKGHRKQVYWKELIRFGDRDVEVLKTYLFEAVEIDKSIPEKNELR